RVKAERPGLAALVGKALDPAQVEAGDAQLAGLLPPEARRPYRVRQGVGAVDEEEGLALDGNVPPVPKCGGEPADMGPVVFLGIVLGHQHLVLLPVPRPGPVFIRPAEAERKVRPPGSQNLVERALQKALAVEPVMVVTEPLDAVLPR